MRVFYHLSPEIQENISIFLGKIPELRAYNEDSLTSRVCLSDSIDGCLSAVPWGAIKLHKTLETQNIFRVYEIREEDIEPNNLISSTELYKSGKVIDAEETGEVWVVNQDVIPFKSYLVAITDYDSEEEDLITYEDLIHCEENGDNFDDYYTTVILIRNTQYQIVVD